MRGRGLSFPRPLGEARCWGRSMTLRPLGGTFSDSRAPAAFLAFLRAPRGTISLSRTSCAAPEAPDFCPGRGEWLRAMYRSAGLHRRNWGVGRNEKVAICGNFVFRVAQPGGAAASGEPSRIGGMDELAGELGDELGELESGPPIDSVDGGMRAGANCERDQVAQPAWGTRGDSPGKRGCWALTKAGRPCAAAVRGDSDYCNAHAGVGVAASPAEHSLVGRQRSAEVRRTRADLRLVLGTTRLDTPRAALRAAAILNAERLAGTTIAAALDPTLSPLARAKLALEIVEAVDPKVSTSLSVTGELDVEQASLGQLMQLAAERGISLERGA